MRAPPRSPPLLRYRGGWFIAAILAGTGVTLMVLMCVAWITV
jgi:hypothetical protein